MHSYHLSWYMITTPLTIFPMLCLSLLWLRHARTGSLYLPCPFTHFSMLLWISISQCTKYICRSKYKLKIEGIICPVENQGKELPSSSLSCNIYFRKLINSFSVSLKCMYIFFETGKLKDSIKFCFLLLFLLLLLLGRAPPPTLYTPQNANNICPSGKGQGVNDFSKRDYI